MNILIVALDNHDYPRDISIFISTFYQNNVSSYNTLQSFCLLFLISLSLSNLSLFSCYQRLMVRWDFSSSLHIRVICVCVGWIGLYARMSKHKGLSGYTAQILSLNIEYKSVSHLFIIHVGCYKFEIFIHSILNQDINRERKFYN